MSIFSRIIWFAFILKFINHYHETETVDDTDIMKDEQGLINYNNFLIAVFRKYYLILFGALPYIIQLFFIVRFKIKDLIDHRLFSTGHSFFSSINSILFEFFSIPFVLMLLIETAIFIWFIIIVFGKSKKFFITPLLLLLSINIIRLLYIWAMFLHDIIIDKGFKDVIIDQFHWFSTIIQLFIIVYLAIVITNYFKLIRSGIIQIICIVFFSLITLDLFIGFSSSLYGYKDLYQDYMLIPLYQIANNVIINMSIISLYIFWVGTFIVYSRHVRNYDV